MSMTATRIVVFFVIVFIVVNPPLVLGFLGEPGRQAGQAIEEAIRSDNLRAMIIGRRS